MFRVRNYKTAATSVQGLRLAFSAKFARPHLAHQYKIILITASLRVTECKPTPQLQATLETLIDHKLRSTLWALFGPNQ